MKYLLLGILVSLFSEAYSQCINITMFPNFTISANQYNKVDTISDSIHAGHYFKMVNLKLEETYQFESSNIGDYITIRNLNDSTQIIAHGISPLNYSVPLNGIDFISIHINLSSPQCGEQAVNRLITSTCITCPQEPTKIGINTNNPKSTLEINGEIIIGETNSKAYEGMVRWNENIKDFEGYNGQNWVSFTKNNGDWGKNPTPIIFENFKSLATDGQAEDYFGFSVDISGDFAIVGAYGDDIGSNNNQGSAYIFKFENNSWIQQAKLIASDGASGDEFGRSVAIDGDFAIVGSYNSNINGNVIQGAAYVYIRIGNNWNQHSKLTALDGGTGDNFGRGVAIFENYALIGSPSDDIGSNDSQGSAYIFKRVGNSWVQETKILATDGGANDRFGYSVSISSTYALVGAYLDDVNSNVDQGSAYMFKRMGNTWVQELKILASDGYNGNYFGHSVSLDNSYCIVGAFGISTDRGAAYIFNLANNNWTQQAKLLASDGASGDYFGVSVSISDEFVLIGASLDDLVGSNTNHGSAYIFKRTQNSWSQNSKFTSSDNASQDNLGFGVGIFGGKSIIGSLYDDNNSNSNQGSIYFLQKN